MKSDHCAKLYDYFSGSLTEEEQNVFCEHLEECSACQEELLELESLTSDLPYLSEPVSPPPGMKARILNNVLNHNEIESGDSGPVSLPTETVNVEPEATPVLKRRNKRLQYWMIGLAACLFLSLIGNVLVVNNQQKGAAGNPSQTTKTLYNVDLAATKSGTASMHATAAMVQHNNNKTLVIEGKGLKPLTGSQVYQVWLIKNGKPVPAGSFKPSKDGKGAVTYQLNAKQPSKWDAVAISVESAPDHTAPQGTIYMEGKF